MAYTVQQLAALSGISIRTLRFYDEIGILKPAWYGNNGYRYYEDAQLLQLQQIMFFRELGFKLSDIRHTLNSSRFNKVEALTSHRIGLEKKIEKLQRLLVTLDKTVKHLKEETKMTPQDMYDGFKPADLPKFDEIAINTIGALADKLIARRKERTKSWSEQDWNNVILERNKLLMEMTSCLHNKLHPSDPAMQKLIDHWYNLTAKPLYSPTWEEFLEICQLNCNHPEFRKSFDFYDDKLASFVYKAAQIYVKNNA